MADTAAAAVNRPTACWLRMPGCCQHVPVKLMPMGLTGGSTAAWASLWSAIKT